MMKENPNLTLSKITYFAKLKWGRLTKEQQMVYERKLEEMNKVYEMREQVRNKNQPNNDHSLVKR
jgi:hypothetical protein